MILAAKSAAEKVINIMVPNIKTLLNSFELYQNKSLKQSIYSIDKIHISKNYVKIDKKLKTLIKIIWSNINVHIVILMI